MINKKIFKDFLWGGVISYCFILAYYLFTIPENSTLPTNLLKTLLVPILTFLFSIIGYSVALFTGAVHLFLPLLALVTVLFFDIKRKYRFLKYRIVCYLLIFSWFGLKAFYETIGGA